MNDLRRTFPEKYPTPMGNGMMSVCSSKGVTMLANDPNLSALSTALEEQLGLRIESRQGPVDVLVIDEVRQPTPN